MKKLLTIIIFIFSFSHVFAVSVFQGFQGGTGIGTTTIGNIGNSLKVQSVNPLVWTIGSTGSGVQQIPTSTSWIDQNLLFGQLGGSATSSILFSVSTSTGQITISSSSLTNVSSTNITASVIQATTRFDTLNASTTGFTAGTLQATGQLTFSSASGTNFGFSSGGYTLGSVGIGMTAPKTLLNVNGGAGAYPTLGTNVANSLFISRNDEIIGMYLGYASDGNGWIQQMRNDSANSGNLVLQPVGGNVGVKTTNPGAYLDVGGGGSSANGNEFHVGGTVTVGASYAVFDSSPGITATANGSAFDFQLAGNINGTAAGTHPKFAFLQISPAMTTDVGATITEADTADILGISAYAHVLTNNALHITAPTGGTSNYAINSTGRVLLKSLTTAGALQTSDLCEDSNQEVTADSVLCVASGEMFKEKINDFSGALQIINQVQPKSFYWKPDFNGSFQSNPNYNGQQLGLLAGEVYAAYPSLATVSPHPFTFENIVYPTGTPNGLNLEAIDGLLWQGELEQQQEISNLFKIVSEQQNVIDKLSNLLK